MNSEDNDIIISDDEIASIEDFMNSIDSIKEIEKSKNQNKGVVTINLESVFNGSDNIEKKNNEETSLHNQNEELKKLLKINDDEKIKKEQNVNFQTKKINDKSFDYGRFIIGLLNNISTKKSEKKKIVDLMLKERDKGFVTEEQVKIMIENYLRKGGETREPNKKNDYPDPKQTYEFLSYFSQNDGGLKNLTHDFNYGYIDYDVFMAQCRKEFEEGKRKYPKVPSRLLGRIEAFAGPVPGRDIQKWLQNERTIIRHGWSDSSFVEWYKTNKLHPSKDAFYNKEMIIPFKESIQVRADTGNLISLLKSLIKKVFGENPSCNVTISEKVKDAQFYTDVDSLGQALYQIFSTIKEYSEKNFCDEVEVDYFTEGEYKVLAVTHVDSKPTKRADDKDYSGGNTNAIRDSLIGLCNYEIRAEFPDGTYRKLILYNYEDYKKYQKDPNAKIIVSEKGGRKEITILVPLDSKTIKGYTHKMLFY